jgi:hypothetical protein
MSGPLSKVRWAGGDSHLISLGAKDRSVFQWRHEIDDLAIAEASAKGGAAAIMQVGRFMEMEVMVMMMMMMMMMTMMTMMMTHLGVAGQIDGEDEDASIYDTEELMKQLVMLESSILPPDDAAVTKNRCAPRLGPLYAALSHSA